MVLPAGLSCLGDAFGKGWSSQQALFPAPCPDALLCRMSAGRGRKTAPGCAPIPLMGAGSVPTPTTKLPLTKTELAGLSHPATTVQLWQESCSNSLLDLATPITKGLAQYQREGGAQHPPDPHCPQRVCEGDRDLAAHLFRSIHLRGTLQGAFCRQEAGAPGQEKNKGRHRHPQPFV